jgi:hypothetical protein
MRKVISFTILALTVMGGVALADHRHDRDGSDRGRWDRHGNGSWNRGNNGSWNQHSGGVVVRDSRWHGGGRIAAPGWQYPRQHSYRRPVYVNNGYYQFHNGYRYAYSRPVFRQRYYDYRVRPQIIVENYQPVEGYIWVGGQWQWNGYEWQWVSGHYDNDPNCNHDVGYDSAYDQPTYDQPTYDESQGNYYPQY